MALQTLMSNFHSRLCVLVRHKSEFAVRELGLMPPLLASQPLGSSFQVTGRAETKEQKSPDESGFYWNAHCEL